MRNVEYDRKPPVYEVINANYSKYRWNIIEVEKEEGSAWKCDEVEVFATVSKDKITKEVINLLYPDQREAKLINDYNSVHLGVCSEEGKERYVEEYTAFLEVRNDIKERIATDCLTFGII